MSTVEGAAEKPAKLHDLACAIHLHSTYSDGTATVPELVDSARAAGCDVVLLTDHDTLGAKDDGWEGWYGEGEVLFGVGVEISATHGHYLAFGLDAPLPHEGVAIAEIPARVRERGGVGFAAHPFSEGAQLRPKVSKRGAPHGWGAIDDPGLTGIELWSLTTDAAEAWRHPWHAIKYLRAPEHFLDGPPQRHLDAWDQLGARRRVAAIAGLDAHQNGFRVRGRVVSPMRNARYFRLLSTYALCRRPPTGDAAADLRAVHEALEAGRCYMSVDEFAIGRGFRFWAEADSDRAEMGEERPAGSWALRAELPQPARMVLRRDGVAVAEREGEAMIEQVDGPGVYRIEAWLHRRGRERPWIFSNPVYLRDGEAGETPG